MLTEEAQKASEPDARFEFATQHKLAFHALKILSDYYSKDYRLLLTEIK